MRVVTDDEANRASCAENGILKLKFSTTEFRSKERVTVSWWKPAQATVVKENVFYRFTERESASRSRGGWLAILVALFCPRLLPLR